MEGQGQGKGQGEVVWKDEGVGEIVGDSCMCKRLKKN